jgi:phage-related protein
MVITTEKDSVIWRNVEWLGDSRKVVRGWPKTVKSRVGDDLAVVQLGEYPDGCEALPDIGANVHAIRLRSGKEQYRVLWIAKLDESVYVIHAFHKKSKSGIATPKKEKELAKERLKGLKASLAKERAATRRN